MGLDMQRVEGHLSLAEVIKGSRVLLWFAHNGMVKGHSCCIVEKGLRRAREEEGGQIQKLCPSVSGYPIAIRNNLPFILSIMDPFSIAYYFLQNLIPWISLLSLSSIVISQYPNLVGQLRVKTKIYFHIKWLS